MIKVIYSDEVTQKIDEWEKLLAAYHKEINKRIYELRCASVVDHKAIGILASELSSATEEISVVLVKIRELSIPERIEWIKE